MSILERRQARRIVITLGEHQAFASAALEGVDEYVRPDGVVAAVKPFSEPLTADQVGQQIAAAAGAAQAAIETLTARMAEVQAEHKTALETQATQAANRFKEFEKAAGDTLNALRAELALVVKQRDLATAAAQAYAGADHQYEASIRPVLKKIAEAEAAMRPPPPAQADGESQA